MGTSLAHPAKPIYERKALGDANSVQPPVPVWFDRDHSNSGPITRTADTIAQWARTHPKAVDAIVGLGLFTLALYSTRLSQIEFVEGQVVIERIRPSAEAAVKLGGKAAEGGEETLRILANQPSLPSVGWLYLLGALSTLPLMLRRRFPDGVHLLVFIGFLLTLWVFPIDVQIASLAAWLSTYTFAAYGRASERVRNAVLILTAVSLTLELSGVVRNREFNRDPLAFRQVFFYALLSMVLYGAPIVLGLVVRRHMATLNQLRARTKTLQGQQLTLQQQQSDLERTAILNERVRISRELHDVVAHHVSVMGMQAGAARLTLGTTDTQVSHALSSIEQSSREAVANLQQLLGFLRSGQHASNQDSSNDAGNTGQTNIAHPQPNLAGIALLIEEHRNAGYSVSASLGSGLDHVQPGVALSGYRIVQEALTNIRKHAHRGDETTVAVLVDSDTLHLNVTNGPPPGTSRNTEPSLPANAQNSGPKLASKYLTGRTAPGLGLRGMNERVELHSGRLSAAATVNGGFRVEASLRGAKAPFGADIQQTPTKTVREVNL